MSPDQDDPHYWWHKEITDEVRAQFKKRPIIAKVTQYRLLVGQDGERILHWGINCWPAMIVHVPYDDVFTFAKFNAAVKAELDFEFDPMSDAEWLALLNKGIARTRKGWFGRIPYDYI